MTAYPRRVQNLEKKLAGWNGKKITAAQSRELMVFLAESHLDLWDVVLDLAGKENQDWGQKAVRWFTRYTLPRLVEYAIIGTFLWRLVIK